MCAFRNLILPTATVLWLTMPGVPIWLRTILADSTHAQPVAVSTLETSLGCNSSSPSCAEPRRKQEPTARVALGEPEIVSRNISEAYLNQNRVLSDLVSQYIKDHPKLPHHGKLLIEKGIRTLTVYLDDTPLKSYPISLGREPVGDKTIQGDMRTPEGRFYIAQKRYHSDYYRALVLSYPETEDAVLGFSRGIISERERQAIIGAIRKFALPPQTTKLGSLIEIHGPHPEGYTGDWTFGCVAMRSHKATDEVFAFSRSGGKRDMPYTLVEIKP